MKKVLLASLAFFFIFNAISQNNAPVAVDDTVEMISQVPYLFDALANDYDPDGDSIYIRYFHGYLWDNVDTVANQLLISTKRFVGKSVLDYRISDNGNPSALSAEAKVFTYILPNPHAPLSQEDTFDLLELGTYYLDVLGNDADPDGDSLKISEIASEKHCEAIISEDSLNVYVRIYQTSNSTASFDYRACEKNTDKILLSDWNMVYINIIPNPDIPLAVPDSATTTGGISISIPVLQNDIDEQGDPLEIYKVLNTTSGQLAIEGETIKYSPDISFSGTIEVSYKIREQNDTSIFSDWSYFKVTVLKNPDCPFGNADQAGGMTIQPFLIDVLDNDIDPPGNGLEIKDIDAQASTEITDNKIKYKSGPDNNGFDIIYYRTMSAEDHSLYSDWTPVYITLQDNPALPVAVDDQYSVNAFNPVLISPLDNDIANSADTLMVCHIQNGYTHRLNYISENVYSYQSYSIAPLIDTLRYEIRDKYNPDLWATGSIYMYNTSLKSFDSIDVNNINAGVNLDGMHFCKIPQIPGIGMIQGDFAPHFKYPKGNATNTILNSTLWIGGQSESGDSIFFSGEKYRYSGVDFQPGPVATSYDSIYKARYWRLWKLNKADVEYHRNHWWQPGYQPIEELSSWPGNGDVSAGQSSQLAPYFDLNKDEHYDPLNGDYPLIRGDQCIFTMYNDDLEHTESQGNRLKVEIHAMVYAFSETADSALDNTIFVHYDLINRSEKVYFNSHAGVFTDFDLGNCTDDYAGSDVARSTYYCYNGDPFDEDYGDLGYFAEGYGDHSPAQGITILAGPLIDPDGIDNPDAQCDLSFNGFNFNNDIVDDERFGLSNFFCSFYESPIGDYPLLSVQMFGLMNGYWKDGTHCYYGGYGHFVSGMAFGPVCNYMFPGNSDTVNWGTGCIAPFGPYNQDGFYWCDSNMNFPGDRRGLGSMGPFTFAPGDIQEIDVAYVVAIGWDGPVSSVNKLMEYIDSLRYKVSQGEIIVPNDKLGINEVMNQSGRLKIYPNPASDKINFTVEGKNGTTCEVKVYDVFGRMVLSGQVVNNELDISGLAPGFYTIRIISDNNLHSGKFIKR